jgi:rhodanese-related sulfurtransferase
MPTRITPQEADTLLKQGYSYLDVRTIPEYEQGHPVGARNVPFMNLEQGRMVLNPEFLALVEKLFPKDSKLVIGCKSGGRSLQAATLLERQGYANLYDMRGGYDGEVNPATGQLVVPGWSRVGLPVETRTPGGSYSDLVAESKRPS